MRNVTLLCIALLIAVGVLAKNPPASAPSLAASLASFPVAPEPQPVPEPIRTDAETEILFAEAVSPTAKVVESVSYRDLVPVDAELQRAQYESVVPTSAAQSTAGAPSVQSEQIVFVPEIEQPLGSLPNHSNAAVSFIAKRSDPLDWYSSGTRFAADEMQPSSSHSAATNNTNNKLLGNTGVFRPVSSNATISETFSKRMLTQDFEPLESGTTISNSFVRKTEFVQALSGARPLPAKDKRIAYSQENVAAAFQPRSFGVLDLLAGNVPEVTNKAKLAPKRQQPAEIELSSSASLSDNGNLNYRRPVSLTEMIAISLADVVERPILLPPTLAKPKSIEPLASLSTSASISSSVSARKMFKDTVSPMLAKSVLMERLTEIENLKLNLSTPSTMTPPMFSVAEAKRYKADVMPVSQSKFSINIAPDPGSVIMSSIADVEPALVDSATAKNANASPARFQLNIQDGGYCDTNFVGPTITFAQTAELSLDDLLYQIHNRFGVNFIMGKGIGSLPINIKSGSIPWNTLLRSLLFVSGVRATCINNSTIELIQNSEVAALEKGRNDAAPLITEFIKLKYLQPTISSNGSASVAGGGGGGGNTGFGGGGGGGQGGGQQGPCQNLGGGGAGGGVGQGGQGGGQGNSGGPQCRYEKLIREIEKILGVNNQRFVLAPTTVVTDQFGQSVRSDVQAANSPVIAGVPSTGSVTEIPGRNILVISAGQSQLDRIKKIIELADRPPFQIIIKGLIYTANETRLKDVGVQPSIFATTADGRSSSGIFGNTLGAGGTLFDFSTIIGTVDFMAQATAFQENGVISIKSRPFATVLEGDTADLTVGRQVPVLITAQNNIGGTPGTLQILQAANLLTATPLIIDDEKGNPIAVNLTLTLQSNEVDTSVTSQGIPSVSVRSVQSRFILNQQQTMILGGFTVDSDSRTVTKTPLLGDIPILGELFKRRLKSSQVNRLYFAVAVEVVAFPTNPVPVSVPGVTTDPPSITPEMKTRGEKGEPKQVTGP